MKTLSFGVDDAFVISVTVGRGRVKVSPDPAEVVQGTKVRFEIRTERGIPDLEVEVYFSKEPAFDWQAAKVRIPYTNDRTEFRRIEAPANEVGDYKYGVRGTTLADHEEIADDDPLLIVIPREEFFSRSPRDLRDLLEGFRRNLGLR